MSRKIYLRKCKHQKTRNLALVFKCYGCIDKFDNEESMKNHKQTDHQKKNLKEKKRRENLPRLFLNRKQECNLCVMKFKSVEFMDMHMDENHGGRWKFSDPDVIFEGDDYEDESSESSYKESFTPILKIQKPKEGNNYCWLYGFQGGMSRI